MPHETIDKVVTSKGSIYTYLPDGRSQRFKRTTGEKSSPQNVLVYLPDFQTLWGAAEDEIRGKFGRGQFELDQLILGYVHRDTPHGFVIVGDSQGNIAHNMIQVINLDHPFIHLAGKNGRIEHSFPVSPWPRVGYLTFDCFETNKGGKEVYSRHLGNDVVEIYYRDGRVVKK